MRFFGAGYRQFPIFKNRRFFVDFQVAGRGGRKSIFGPILGREGSIVRFFGWGGGRMVVYDTTWDPLVTQGWSATNGLWELAFWDFPGPPGPRPGSKIRRKVPILGSLQKLTMQLSPGPRTGVGPLRNRARQIACRVRSSGRLRPAIFLAHLGSGNRP